jgi:predicted permease
MLAPAGDPVRLVLTADWRVLGFGCALTMVTTLLFGLAPALHASVVQPNSALRGGADSRSRRGLMNLLVAAQVAFCVLVLFVAGLFVSTFQRLSSRPLGFSQQGLLIVQTAVRGGKETTPETWRQAADQLRQTPGVESVAAAGWPPLSGKHLTADVRVPGRAAEPKAPYFLDVSGGYFETMRIGWIDGRDFRPGDVPPRLTADRQPSAGVGIVNEAFARRYFDGQNPVGKMVAVRRGKDAAIPLEIVGYVRDACYSNVREVIRPTVYVPVAARSNITLLVRATGEPRALAPILRREVPRMRSELRVNNVGMQSALVSRQMIRERLLATLSLFFAVVALVLASIGLYGVLNYLVIQQRREIGIRMALGARSAHVVRRITTGIFATVMLGSVVGVAGGLASARFVEALLYEVKATDAGMVIAPVAMLVFAALLAAVPPAMRAVRVDPAETLRSE